MDLLRSGPALRAGWPGTACLAALAALAAATASCSSHSGPPKKACFPVSGAVTVKGKPAEGAVVILRPLPEANPDEWSAGFPRANVGADGKFKVGTYADDDGAPAGEYAVLITWMAADPQNEEASGTDRLGGRYADAATSKLTAKVEPRPNELPPIQLP